MPRDYPRLGEWRKPKPNSERKCDLCQGTPAGIQFIQVDYMRGNDEPMNVCQPCQKTRKAEIVQLYEKMCQEANVKPCTPGSPEWHLRAQVMRELEAKNAEGLWWLSFVNPELPEGQRFLGVSIVRARGVLDAATKAHRQRINPGGEVASFELTGEPPLFIPEKYIGRLLTRAEAEECQAEVTRLIQEAKGT